MRVLVWEALNSTSMRCLRIVFWANFNHWKNTKQYSQIRNFLDYRVQNVPELLQKLLWLVAFRKRPSASIGHVENFVYFKFLEGQFYKEKPSFVNLKKTNHSFWSVCFSGVFLALKCETLVLFTIAIELSHFWGFLSRSHIFTWTTWPETLWPRGIMRPRD